MKYMILIIATTMIVAFVCIVAMLLILLYWGVKDVVEDIKEVHGWM